MLLLKDVPKQVDKIRKRYDTSDPFEIAELSGIQIKYNDFGDDVFGFYYKSYRIKFIFLNILLPEKEERFTCAHELMHALFHQNENTPKLSRTTLSSTTKIEAQANCGATHLLIDGSHEFELHQPSTYEILNFYGLPIEMGRYI